MSHEIKLRPWEKHFEFRKLNFMRYNKAFYDFLVVLASEVGNSILDVGCATCNLYLSCKDNNLTYTGLDSIKKFLNHAKQLYPGINVRLGTVLDLPFRDKFFDVIIAKDLLEHLHPDDTELAISEMMRVAKKRVLISFFKKPNPKATRITGSKDDHFSIRHNSRALKEWIEKKERFKSLTIHEKERMQTVYVIDLTYGIFDKLKGIFRFRRNLL